MFACCSRCSSSAPPAAAWLQPVFRERLLFFPRVSTSALVCHTSHMSSYFCKKPKNQNGLKDDAFHRWGLEKQMEPHVNVKSDALQSPRLVVQWCNGGRWLCAATTRTGRWLYFTLSFRDIFLFVLYWSMTSALHVCNKCCSVLYFCLVVFSFWCRVACPPFLLCLGVIWFDHKKKVHWKNVQRFP